MGVLAWAPMCERLPHRKLEQYCEQLALKINTKLGGTTVRMAGEEKGPGGWAPILGDRHFMVRG